MEQNKLTLGSLFDGSGGFPLGGLLSGITQMCIRDSFCGGWASWCMCWTMRSRLEECWMRYKPHEYQKYAVEYIKTHPAASIFLDCGLGKTSITLTAIADLLFDSFEIHKVLVIAPLRVARDTWTAEADKWDHLQNLICSVAVGTEAQRRAALMRYADIYIINPVSYTHLDVYKRQQLAWCQRDWRTT